MRRVVLSLVLAVAFNNFALAQVANGSQPSALAGRAKLCLFTRGGKQTIKGTARSTFSGEESAYQSQVVIIFESLASANLVVPAFKQAIQLCQKQ
jgi:hypothetical protein